MRLTIVGKLDGPAAGSNAEAAATTLLQVLKGKCDAAHDRETRRVAIASLGYGILYFAPADRIPAVQKAADFVNDPDPQLNAGAVDALLQIVRTFAIYDRNSPKIIDHTSIPTEILDEIRAGLENSLSLEKPLRLRALGTSSLRDIVRLLPNFLTPKLALAIDYNLTDTVARHLQDPNSLPILRESVEILARSPQFHKLLSELAFNHERILNELRHPVAGVTGDLRETYARLLMPQPTSSAQSAAEPVERLVSVG